MDTNLIAVIAVVVVLLVAAALLLARRQRSEHLREQFGPEYERACAEMGSPSKAEAELAAREKRVRKLEIVPLTPADAAHFTRSWQALQSRFIDSPQGTLHEADQLVRELMLQRGYPMGDFESRAADISVDHPAVVDHYRAAHAIAQRDLRGQADTEALRQAIVHYRSLFSELLEVAQPAAATRDVVREDAPRRALPLREHAMAQREPRDPPQREPRR